MSIALLIIIISVAIFVRSGIQSTLAPFVAVIDMNWALIFCLGTGFCITVAILIIIIIIVPLRVVVIIISLRVVVVVVLSSIVVFTASVSRIIIIILVLIIVFNFTSFVSF